MFEPLKVLSFLVIFRAFSWPIVFCQKSSLWEQKKHGQLSESISGGLEEDLWAAESLTDLFFVTGRF